MRRAALSALALLAACSSLAQAHEFWIKPSSFRVRAGVPLSVSLMVGDGFPGEAVPRDPRRIVRFDAVMTETEAAMSCASKWQISEPAATDPAMPIVGAPGADPAGAVAFGASGTAILVYRSNNARVELDAEKFEDYLREDGMAAIIEKRRQRGESGKPGRELYSRCCKALVRVAGADGAAQPIADRVVGLRHELVLLGVEDDDRTAPGQTLRVRDLFDGKPIAGVMVSVRSPEHPGQKISAKTDDRGEATLEVPWGGELLVSAVHMVEAPTGSDAEWESTWTSLSFDSSTVWPADAGADKP